MYFPNAASGYEWNRMATLSIRFYSLHPWVHCVLYKFVVFEIFVVEESIRNFKILKFASQGNHLLLGLLRLLFVNLGCHDTHVLGAPVVADVAELSSGTVIDIWRV